MKSREQLSPARGRICLGCRDQMGVPIPLRGALALPFRLVGITRSKMNPNICTICERAFRRVKKRRHITETVTILFADIRGYTELSEHLLPDTLADLVLNFHDNCARGIWERDGIVNRQMGDGLMAIFNFPIKKDNHAAAAIDAAIEIQRRCKLALSQAPELELACGVGVGVGIHTGEVELGQFSTDRSDFTAIGGASTWLPDSKRRHVGRSPRLLLDHHRGTAVRRRGLVAPAHAKGLQ